MIEWSVDIRTTRYLPSFEVPIHVEVEVQEDESYCHEGRFYKEQKHVIILFTYSGQGLFIDRDGKYELNPGSCLLCYPGATDICYKYPPGHKEPWRFLWFGFAGGSTRDKTSDLLDRFGPVYELTFNSKMIERLELLRAYNDVIYEMSPFEGSRLVLDVLCELGESTSANSVSQSNLLMQRTLKLIDAQLNEKISVNGIARTLKVSREHLSRVFKESTGTTLQKYIIDRKLKIACKLLNETNLSIKQITVRLGFNDQRNFSRTFHKKTGMTPRDFRNANLEIIL
ncbi:Regulatory protein SoxS [Anaerohalosphaera lusitana]|uniref:Regulatory protein SoxS n=1 Tax=Anaerohalosphaera lusitana TaxID=1936003 RepID=A0A1U9NME2_9BACT|nr:AraC family transcriptional regulator [Anaerohalosphaera lusitana]AQT69079.1 Regulatory protein SoxS [Anaerohalosphaera lusitana]